MVVKIKVGMVGLGNIAKVHCIANMAIPLILNDLPFEVQIGKVYKRNRDIKLYFCEGYADSLEELLEDAETNVIDITSPNYFHTEQAIKVMNYRKNIYLEKPIGLNLKEAKLIHEKAKGKKVINQTAFIYRFMPAIVNIRDLMQEKAIGEIINFKIITLHSGYLNEKRPISWKLKLETSGGGPLLDIGIHLADIIRFTLGEVKEVSARTETVIKKRPDELYGELVTVDVEDWGIVNLKLKNGIQGIMEVSRVASILEENTIFEVYGTKGSLKFTEKEPKRILFYSQEKRIQEVGETIPNSNFAKFIHKTYPPEKLSLGWLPDAHFASLVNFYHNITSGKVIYPETPTFDEAVKSQSVIEACYLSAKNGGNPVIIKETP